MHSVVFSKMVIFNKKASFKYQLGDSYEAGIVLTGKEVKAYRKGSVDLSQAFAKILGTEIFLINANFGILDPDISTTRSRKLLLHKKEIYALESMLKAKKLTLVPKKLYNKGRKIKLELALGKGKKEFEKRDVIKKADIKRDLERELRGSKDNNSRV